MQFCLQPFHSFFMISGTIVVTMQKKYQFLHVSVSFIYLIFQQSTILSGKDYITTLLINVLVVIKKNLLVWPQIFFKLIKENRHF